MREKKARSKSETSLEKSSHDSSIDGSTGYRPMLMLSVVVVVFPVVPMPWRRFWRRLDVATQILRTVAGGVADIHSGQRSVCREWVWRATTTAGRLAYRCLLDRHVGSYSGCHDGVWRVGHVCRTAHQTLTFLNLLPLRMGVNQFVGRALTATPPVVVLFDSSVDLSCQSSYEVIDVTLSLLLRNLYGKLNS